MRSLLSKERFFSMFFLVLNSNIQSAYSNFFLLSCFLTNWIWMSVHLLHCNLDMMATGLLTRLQTKLFSFILFRSARQKWPRCADTQKAAHKSQLYFLWHLLEAPAVLLLFQQGGRHAAAAARMNVTAGAMPDGGSCVVFFSVIASALCRVCVCMCVCEHAGKVKTTYGMKLKPTWVTARWFQFFAARPMHEQQAEEEEERWGRGGGMQTHRGMERKTQTKQTNKEKKQQNTCERTSTWKKKWLTKKTFNQNVMTQSWCPWWGVWSDRANAHWKFGGWKHS